MRAVPPVNVAAHGVTLSPGDVNALARELRDCSRIAYSTRLANHAVYWASIAGRIAVLMTIESEQAKLTVTQYSALHGIPERTVQYQCQYRKIPATKVDRRWQIAAA